MKLLLPAIILVQLTFISVMGQDNEHKVKIANGTLSGTVEKSGVLSFKGIPYAAPPVGNLRWKEPQPVKNWQGVLKADKFGKSPMQPAIFGDMNFRSGGISEDCLYLNVWAPSKKATGLLPVLVYFYGGGFVAGDGSEPRYDGESMAAKGIVALTVNYRLGVFGFIAHPGLTSESPHHSSGNYALLDQASALRWVKQNIAAFGGDPDKITIAGESAGSVSVSAQMVSPLSKNLIAGAIMESGSLLGTLPPVELSQAEQTGVEFSKTIGANSLTGLRTLSADSLLKASVKFGVMRFSPAIDGYFFPRTPAEILEAGEQAHVPLLAGWNSEEMNYRTLMGNDALTKENYEKAVKKLYNDKADEFLKVYHAEGDEQVEQAATDFAGDRFIGFSTWRWTNLQAKTGGKPVYRYYYSHPRPAMNAEMGNAVAGLAGGVQKGTNAPKMPTAKGAVHSAEIEYAMGNLSSNKVYAWTADDHKVSETMQAYFANFIKTGNPNGAGLPQWPSINNTSPAPVLHIDVNTRAEPAKTDDRYLFMEKTSGK